MVSEGSPLNLSHLFAFLLIFSSKYTEVKSVRSQFNQQVKGFDLHDATNSLLVFFCCFFLFKFVLLSHIDAMQIEVHTQSSRHQKTIKLLKNRYILQQGHFWNSEIACTFSYNSHVSLPYCFRKQYIFSTKKSQREILVIFLFISHVISIIRI